MRRTCIYRVAVAFFIVIASLLANAQCAFAVKGTYDPEAARRMYEIEERHAAFDAINDFILNDGENLVDEWSHSFLGALLIAEIVTLMIAIIGATHLIRTQRCPEPESSQDDDSHAQPTKQPPDSEARQMRTENLKSSDQSAISRSSHDISLEMADVALFMCRAIKVMTFFAMGVAFAHMFAVRLDWLPFIVSGPDISPEFSFKNDPLISLVALWIQGLLLLVYARYQSHLINDFVSSRQDQSLKSSGYLLRRSMIGIWLFSGSLYQYLSPLDDPYLFSGSLYQYLSPLDNPYSSFLNLAAFIVACAFLLLISSPMLIAHIGDSRHRALTAVMLFACVPILCFLSISSVIALIPAVFIL